jgi:hypothetical protein
MMEDRLRPNYGHPGGCADLPVEACPAITQNNVLWGDSHAMHLSDALQEMGFVHSQRTKSACAPLVGVSGFISEAHHYDLAWARSCAAFNRETFEELMAHEEPGVVFLSSSTWLSGYRHFLYDIDGSVKDEDWRTVLENSARTTFVPLLEKGWTVVFLGPGIGGTKNIGQCSAIVAWTGFVDRDACSFVFSNQKELVETEIDRITKELGFTFIPIHPWICPQGICNRAVEEDVYIWRDVSHLSHEGSRWLGRQQGFKEAIDKAMSSNISAHTLD